MNRNIGIGKIGASIMALIFFVVLTAVIAGLASLIPGNTGGVIAVIVCFIGAVGVLLYPITIAADVSDRIPEIKSLFLLKPELKCYKIRHQYYPIIILITLIFGATGVGYVIAFVWAHTPGNVMIPDEIVAELNNLKSENEPKGSPTVPPQIPTPVDQSAPPHLSETEISVFGIPISKVTQSAPPHPSEIRPPPVGQEIQFQLVHNGQQLGPFDFATLQQMHRGGILITSSMVWQKGMPDWQAASSVPELAVIFQTPIHFPGQM